MGTTPTGSPAARRPRFGASIAIRPAAALSILLGGLAGCESPPGDAVVVPADLREVRLQDDLFLSFGGERMPIDEFLFRMRQLGRQAAADGKPMFGVRILLPTPRVDPKLVERIVQDLRLSGVKYVTMG